jgi:hypothetical protein
MGGGGGRGGIWWGKEEHRKPSSLSPIQRKDFPHGLFFKREMTSRVQARHLDIFIQGFPVINNIFNLYTTVVFLSAIQ